MEVLAVSTGIQIAYVVGLVVVLFIGPVTVAEMKGNSMRKLARAEARWGKDELG